MGDDDVSYVQYNSSEDRQRCSNGCYRWYIVETSGGNYTQYRSRTVYKEYVFCEWSEWPEWSEWHDNAYAYGLGDNIDFEERKLYRYKEK